MSKNQKNLPKDPLSSYREELIKLYEKNNDNFEKQLSYISAGALGATFLIVEKVLKDVFVTNHKWLLIASWFFLAATLFINLLSHIYSSNIQYKIIEEIDTKNYDQGKAKDRNNKIKLFNRICLGTLSIGITLFIIYASYNITK